MSTKPSTFASRNLIVDEAQTIAAVHVMGDTPYRVDPPFQAEAGIYRAELDLETHTATISEVQR